HCHFGDKTTFLRLLLALELCVKHCHDSERQRERGKHRNCDGYGHMAQEDGNLVGRCHNDWHKHDDRCHRTRDDGKSDLFHPGDGGLERIHAVEPMSVDALCHNDGIVDQHAYGQHETHHGEDVQRVASHVHEADGD